MKVQDVMISPARSCTPEAAIVDAARTMWDNHCGALPVLDEKGGYKRWVAQQASATRKPMVMHLSGGKMKSPTFVARSTRSEKSQIE